jgi:hypothetical protein
LRLTTWSWLVVAAVVEVAHNLTVEAVGVQAVIKPLIMLLHCQLPLDKHIELLLAVVDLPEGPVQPLGVVADQIRNLHLLFQLAVGVEALKEQRQV